MEKVHIGNLVGDLETVVGARVKKLGCTWSCSCRDNLYDKILLMDKSLFLGAILDVAQNSCEAYFQTTSGVEKLVTCEVLHNDEDTFPFTFKIIDSGAGIAGHMQEHVFSHFYTDKTGHIGMGLTFARRIIEEQGGTMTIESQPGNGTTVNIRVIRERRRSLRIKRLP
jgi:nitrogen-specific signal transduction histidine kinase